MEDIKDYLNIEIFPDDERVTCTLSADCLRISCSTPPKYSPQFYYNFTLIPCGRTGLTIDIQEPPSFSYSQTFTDSRVDNVSAPGVGTYQFNVTLDRMESALGVKARAGASSPNAVLYTNLPPCLPPSLIWPPG